MLSSFEYHLVEEGDGLALEDEAQVKVKRIIRGTTIEDLTIITSSNIHSILTNIQCIILKKYRHYPHEYGKKKGDEYKEKATYIVEFRSNSRSLFITCKVAQDYSREIFDFLDNRHNDC